MFQLKSRRLWWRRCDRLAWLGIGGELAAALLFAVALSSLLGHLVELRISYPWGGALRLPFSGALLIGALAAALLWAVRRWESKRRDLQPLPVSVAAGAAILPVVLVFWQALVVGERHHVRRLIEHETRSATERIEVLLQSETAAFQRMAHRWRLRGGTPRREWEADAQRYVSDQPGIVAAYWIDGSLRVRWSVPARASLAGRGDAYLLRELFPALEGIRDANQPALLPVTTAEEQARFLIAAPIQGRQTFSGFVAGELDAPSLADAVGRTISPGYAFEILHREAKIFGQEPAGQNHLAAWGAEAAIDLPGVSWRLRLWPEPEYLDQELAALMPAKLLGLGLALMICLVLLSHLGYGVRLRRENIEWRRTEEHLRRLVDHLPDPLVVTTLEGDILLAGGESERLFQTSCDQLVGRNIEDLVPKRFRARHRELWPEYKKMQRKMRVKRRILRADGSEVPVEITMSPLETEDGMLIVNSLRDITQREEAARALREKTEELERSNQELEQFAYVASHDLQEPLRKVGSFTRLLQKRYQGKLDAKADEFIDYAVDGAERMRTLIQDLLTYSRVGRAKLSRQSTDCREVVARTLDRLSSQIEESGAVVTCSDLPLVDADPTLLGQLFQNLLSNAVKFRKDEENPRIHVGIEEGDGEWVFSVEDDGIGIDSEFLEQVFSPFRRLHNRTRFEGTGIGLAVCKKVVESHGGRIWAESGPAGGSVFRFTLPRKGELQAHVA